MCVQLAAELTAEVAVEVAAQLAVQLAMQVAGQMVAAATPLKAVAAVALLLEEAAVPGQGSR